MTALSHTQSLEHILAANSVSLGLAFTWPHLVGMCFWMSTLFLWEWLIYRPVYTTKIHLFVYSLDFYVASF